MVMWFRRVVDIRGREGHCGLAVSVRLTATDTSAVPAAVGVRRVADDTAGVHVVVVGVLGHYHSVAHGQKQEKVLHLLGLELKTTKAC